MADDKRQSENILHDTGQEEKKSVKEQALERSMQELFSTDKMKMKADLNPQQITSIARGVVFADKYENKTMATLIDNMLQLSVSKGRKGREEFVQLVQKSQEDGDEDGNRRLMDRLLNQ